MKNALLWGFFIAAWCVAAYFLVRPAALAVARASGSREAAYVEDGSCCLIPANRGLHGK